MTNEEDDRWDKTPGEIRKGGSRTSPAITICLPCDRCGTEVATARFYMTAKSRTDFHLDKYQFLPALSVRLCAACLEAALEVLRDDG